MKSDTMRRNITGLPFTAVCLCLLAGASELLASGNEVLRWNEIAGKASFLSGLAGNPLFDSRVYAMTQAAVHDALNAIDRRAEPYTSNPPLSPGASPEAAVATAAYRVLSDQYQRLIAYGHPPQQVALERAYAASLALIPDGPAKMQGIRVGTMAASAILARRANDGWDKHTLLDTTYPQGDEPGEFRFIPGANFAFLPYWGNLPPFVLFRANQFRSGPPPRIDSPEYARDFNEIKSLGGDGVTTRSARTPEQTEIALFWVESSPLGWNRIARTVAAQRRTGLWEPPGCWRC